VDRQLTLIPLSGLPDFKAGDNVPEIIINNARRQLTHFYHNDILVITQKIISKSESRLFDLRNVTVSLQAFELGTITGKDARLVQLILDESQEVLRARHGLIIVRHKLGFVCANAGIDHSNTVPGEEADNFVLLLPEDPDKSARKIQNEIYNITGLRVGVLIIDSHGRAWRNGTIGSTIGMAGVPGVVDLRGKKDLYGYTLKATQVAAADELAAAASLVMGQADESIPCVIARGFPYALRESSLHELIRSEDHDLFK
jgi:coenzyme F420-0:L-glutamate ligase/coenzyme F420-1:gamma-L-glutamate ligase